MPSQRWIVPYNLASLLTTLNSFLAVVGFFVFATFTFDSISLATLVCSLVSSSFWLVSVVVGVVGVVGMHNGDA